jgi:hypothetical protein
MDVKIWLNPKRNNLHFTELVGLEMLNMPH